MLNSVTWFAQGNSGL